MSNPILKGTLEKLNVIWMIISESDTCRCSNKPVHSSAAPPPRRAAPHDVTTRTALDTRR